MSSRQDRFDRADFERPRRTPVVVQEAPEAAPVPLPVISAPPEPVVSGSEQTIWPIARIKQSDIGDTVMRNRRGRPHNGIDLHGAAGTAIIAARSGRILRIVDGRQSKRPSLRRAGLFVDILGADSLIYRYMHLGSKAENLVVNQDIQQGSLIGAIAKPHTSGLGKRPHLHFEIRRSDYNNESQDYGPAINPLQVLPRLVA